MPQGGKAAPPPTYASVSKIAVQVFHQRRSPSSLRDLSASNVIFLVLCAELVWDSILVKSSWRQWAGGFGWKVPASQGKGAAFVLPFPLLLAQLSLFDKLAISLAHKPN